MNHKFSTMISCLVMSLIFILSGCLAPEKTNQKILDFPIITDKNPEHLPLFIPADNPGIEYTGRIDFRNPEEPVFSFPAVSISTQFTGKSIAIILKDTGNKNYFNVIIDGKDPIIINTKPGTKIYEVARDLEEKEHEITIFKRTESICGISSFKGFLLDTDSKIMGKPMNKTRNIEFIGDSITCGYGNMVSTDSPQDFPFTPENENSYQSWGALICRELNANFISTSYSGKGLFRNNDGTEYRTLPLIYKAIFPDSPSKAVWDTSRFHPDVIVINLGTNDYSSQIIRKDLSQEEFDRRFTETYSTFIDELREFYGKETIIICCVGPMMSDYWPQGTSSWTRIIKNVSSMVEQYNSDGDRNIHFFKLTPQTAPYGEDWHPTTATHRNMADQIIPAIREYTGW